MSDYSELMEQFIDSQTGAVDCALTKSVIERMGGEAQFIEDYEHVAFNGHDGFEGLEGGFCDTVNLIEFYNDNSDDIKRSLKLLAQEVGLDSAISLIVEQSKLVEKRELTLDDIADALFGALLSPDDTGFIREEVITWVGFVIGYEVCRNYDSFVAELDD